MDMDTDMDVEGVSIPRRLGLTNTIQASFGAPDDPDYIFDIVASQDNSVMAVSLSTNVIKLYSPMTGQYLGDIIGHEGTISEISFSDVNSSQLLHSCSVDGTIRAWDTRNRQQVSILRGNSSSDEMFSLNNGGPTGDLVAAGSKAKVLFWDWRNQKQVACLEECHMEDVTQVRFHPNHRDKLLSGSVDGLTCVIDASGNINDDDQLESVMNVGTSIARIGFYGASNQKLWCLTHIETLSIWDWEDALQEAVFGDARTAASANWNLPHVDYFVDCHYSLSQDSLWLKGGTNDGSLGYFPVSYNTRSGQSQPNSGVIGSVNAVLDGGHIGVVRSVWSPLNAGVDPIHNQHIVWTGGEDGRLCCWSEGDISAKNKAWISPGLVMKTTKNSKQNRHRPY
ncbi:hypothetical protein SUGI_0224190 [Cryptomeria japonica]|uniref:WD repeat-containing protein GTS1 n=1 Tax=Cryptomeria japonica TaxID=3369 RepID=UPI002408D9FC|nr:WD repeat-containing protein GTS1 [Cryptomeria japonica]GLJ14025.1 hypothetical protein SUGI_0224190 [Cryptomeria japonica]